MYGSKGIHFINSSWLGTFVLRNYSQLVVDEQCSDKVTLISL